MLKKAVLSLGSILLLYTFLGFVVLPLLLKEYIPQFFSQTYHLETKLEDVSFHPFSFELCLDRFKIYQDHKTKKLLSFGKLLIDLDPSELIDKKLTFSTVKIKKLYINPVFYEKEGLNLVRIFSSSTKSKKETSSPFPLEIVVKQIDIKDSDVKFGYITKKMKKNFTLNDVDLHIGTYIFGSKEVTPFTLLTKIDHRALTHIKGKFTLKPSLDLTTSIDLQRYDLEVLSAFLEPFTNIVLQQGYLTLKTTLHVKGDTLILEHIDTKIDMLNIQDQKTVSPVVSLKNLHLKDGYFNSKSQKLTFHDVVFQEGDIVIVRYDDGSFSLQKLLKPSEQKLERKKSSFDFYIDLLKINGTKITFDDKQSAHKFVLAQTNVSVKNLHNKMDNKTPFELSTQYQKATLYVKGNFQTQPLMLQSSLHVEKLSLKEFSSYIEKASYIKIKDALGFLDANITYKKDSKKPDLHIQGDLLLQNVALLDTRDDKKILGAKKIAMDNFKVELFPNRAYINQVKLDDLFVYTHIDRSKQVNFLTLAKTSNKRIKTQKKKFPYAIGNISIHNSSAYFKDDSLALPFQTNIHDLDGKIYALSNNSKEISYINMQGVVNKYGSMKLEGNFLSSDPKEFLDTDMEFRNIALKRFSGYTLHYLGYKIKSGKLFLKLIYKMNKAKLHSTNKIILKDVTLEAMKEEKQKLPLSLVLALLQDNNGEIHLELPVDGDLNDPQFHYTQVIQKSFEDIIKKVITSPFYLVADLVGLDANELSYIGFEAGSASLLPSQKEKLDKLALFLKKRPQVILDIAKVYDPKKDQKALAQKQLLQKLLRESDTKSQKELQKEVALDLIKSFYIQRYSKRSLEDIEISLKKRYKTNENVYNIELRKKLFDLLVQKETLNLNSLKDLAKQRAFMIKNYLIMQKGIAKEQLKIRSNVEEANDKNDLVKVALDLKND